MYVIDLLIDVYQVKHNRSSLINLLSDVNTTHEDIPAIHQGVALQFQIENLFCFFSFFQQDANSSKY